MCGCVQIGKARRLKQAKEEAQQEIEVYRQDCEKQYREHEAKVSTRLCLVDASAQNSSVSCRFLSSAVNTSAGY